MLNVQGATIRVSASGLDVERFHALMKQRTWPISRKRKLVMVKGPQDSIGPQSVLVNIRDWMKNIHLEGNWVVADVKKNGCVAEFVAFLLNTDSRHAKRLKPMVTDLLREMK